MAAVAGSSSVTSATIGQQFDVSNPHDLHDCSDVVGGLADDPECRSRSDLVWHLSGAGGRDVANHPAGRL